MIGYLLTETIECVKILQGHQVIQRPEQNSLVQKMTDQAKTNKKGEIETKAAGAWTQKLLA